MSNGWLYRDGLEIRFAGLYVVRQNVFVCYITCIPFLDLIAAILLLPKAKRSRSKSSIDFLISITSRELALSA